MQIPRAAAWPYTAASRLRGGKLRPYTKTDPPAASDGKSAVRIGTGGQAVLGPYDFDQRDSRALIWMESRVKLFARDARGLGHFFNHPFLRSASRIERGWAH